MEDGRRVCKYCRVRGMEDDDRIRSNCWGYILSISTSLGRDFIVGIVLEGMRNLSHNWNNVVSGILNALRTARSNAIWTLPKRKWNFSGRICLNSST